MNKKIIALLLSVTLGISTFGGCTSASQEGASSNGGNAELTIGVTSFADTLEPTEQYFSWVLTRYGVGETLVKFDASGKMESCLAENWENSEDGKSWSFQIREDVFFSNGSQMTPELVKASLERTFSMSDRANEFFQPESIEVDGQTVVITTANPTATVPGSLADPLFLIMDTTANLDTIEEMGPVCTGPYVVESFAPTQNCVVIKNEQYWGGEVPLEKVTFQCIDDQTTRSMALQSGEVDVAYNLKTENLIDFEDNEAYQVQELESLRSTYAFMNENGVLSDLTLRQALIRGLDKETYCKTLLEGGASAGSAPVPPTLDYGFDQLVDENAYDPEGAKTLLAQAGYKDTDGDGYVETPEGETIDLNFVIYTSREELNVYAQAAQASLKEIGIKVTLNTVSYETLLDLRDSGEYDLLIWNVLVGNTGDPENYLRENWYATSPANTAGYSNEKVDELLDQLKQEFDEDTRKEVIQQIQQEIMNDAATVFFGYETTYLISSAKVTGLTMYPMDYYWLTKDVSITE